LPRLSSLPALKVHTVLPAPLSLYPRTRPADGFFSPPCHRIDRDLGTSISLEGVQGNEEGAGPPLFFFPPYIVVPYSPVGTEIDRGCTDLFFQGRLRRTNCLSCSLFFYQAPSFPPRTRFSRNLRKGGLCPPFPRSRGPLFLRRRSGHKHYSFSPHKKKPKKKPTHK